jgi:hypothetical protein
VINWHNWIMRYKNSRGTHLVNTNWQPCFSSRRNDTGYMRVYVHTRVRSLCLFAWTSVCVSRVCVYFARKCIYVCMHAGPLYAVDRMGSSVDPPISLPPAPASVSCALNIPEVFPNISWIYRRTFILCSSKFPVFTPVVLIIPRFGVSFQKHSQ